MQYNSWLYLFVFLPAAVGLYVLTPAKKRWVVLLLASLGFYLLSAGWLLFFVAGSAVSIWLGGLWIGRQNDAFQTRRNTLSREERKREKARLTRRNRRILTLVAGINLGTLFLCKYLGFALENLNRLTALLGLGALPLWKTVLPLGISFYTLAAIGYLTDVLRGSLKPEPNYGKLLLFLSFFPAITEGPIARYGDLGPQLTAGTRPHYRQTCFALQLLLWGLVQKVVLADRLNRLVKAVFDAPGAHHGPAVALGILAYTLQIYCDFAGCIDISRGSAELFGIRLAPNFARPFFARSVNEFWRRWHITLGSWLRDYIFYPISMSKAFQTLSRRSRAKLPAHYAAALPALLALLAVWTANGLWHGAEWKYLVYGLYYYLIMALGMLLEPLFVRLLTALHLHRDSRGYRWFQTLRTFLLVNGGMLLFRANSLSTAGKLFRCLFQPMQSTEPALAQLLRKNGMGPKDLILVLTGVLVLWLVGRKQEAGVSVREALAEQPLPLRWACYLLGIGVVAAFGAYGAGYGAVDFLYAQF